jgi:Ca-activated chloride channel family protein
MNILSLDIQFQAWHVWKYLPLFLVIGLLYNYQLYKKLLIVKLLASPKWRSSLLLHASTTKFLIKTFVFMLGLFFLFITFLQPAWGKRDEIVAQEGRDLLIALDVSKSMLAQDRNPNRLEFAKTKIKKLVKTLECERVGLIIFAGSTIVLCPLTSDYKSFFMFLDQIDEQTISSGTTALDQAILKSIKIFEDMGSKKNKLLTIFTDGEDFSSNLAGVKAKAVDLGLTIFTIGLGTQEGAPIPLYDDHGNSLGHQKDDKGTVVISRLNEGILRALARETGGNYLLAQESDEDIRSLLQQLQQFEKEGIEDKKFSNLIERYAYFAAVSCVCFALEWLV